MVKDTLFKEAAFMVEEEINEGDCEDENEDYQYSHHAFMFHIGPPTKIADMVQSAGSWKPSKELLAKSKECEHETTIDPVTGKEIKGKERMIFNYKSLNDNTYKDQYSLLVINMIIKRVGGAKIFLKFDLKLGFHPRSSMDEDQSTDRIAAVYRETFMRGLVMPFGLKNAPTVF
ncbi:hypothetical protein Tco_0471497 [Tanacetum coccineum]